MAAVAPASMEATGSVAETKAEVAGPARSRTTEESRAAVAAAVAIAPAPRAPADAGTPPADTHMSDTATARWHHAQTSVKATVRLRDRVRNARAAWQRRLFTGTGRVVKYEPPQAKSKVAAATMKLLAPGAHALGDLINAAHNGETDEVKRLLAAHPEQLGGKHIDDVLESCDEEKVCRQTALMKAVRFGHVETARVLLDAGADPLYDDTRHHTPWYYCCFSVTMPEGTHPAMMALLLEYIPPERITALLLRLACHSSKGVTDLALDTIKRKVVTRDADYQYTVVFENLHYLDAGNGQDGEKGVMWPNNWPAPIGETCLDALVAREAPELTHPAVMALLNWKVERFAKRLAIVELTIYSVWLFAMSVVCMLVTRGATERSVGADQRESGFTFDLNAYGTAGGDLLPYLGWSAEDIDWMTVRVVFEALATVLGIYQFSQEVQDVRSMRKHSTRLETFLGWVRCAVYMSPVLVGVLRLAGVSARVQIDIMALAVVTAWLSFVRLLVLVPKWGQFFLMVAVMLRRDIPLFLVIVSVIVPGFMFAFSMLHANVPELYQADMIKKAYAPGMLTSGFSSFMVVSGLGEWNGGAHHANITFSGLWLVFVLIGPVLSLNLLIAMLNNTYMLLQSAVMKEWVMRMAAYVARREKVLEPEVVRMRLPVEAGQRATNTDPSRSWRGHSPRHDGDAAAHSNVVAIKAKYDQIFCDDYTAHPGAQPGGFGRIDVGSKAGGAAAAAARAAAGGGSNPFGGDDLNVVSPRAKTGFKALAGSMMGKHRAGFSPGGSGALASSGRSVASGGAGASAAGLGGDAAMARLDELLGKVDALTTEVQALRQRGGAGVVAAMIHGDGRSGSDSLSGPGGLTGSGRVGAASPLPHMLVDRTTRDEEALMEEMMRSAGGVPAGSTGTGQE